MKSSKLRDCVTLYLRVIILLFLFGLVSTMTAEDKMKAKEHVVELFYHSYNAYMENAYPADELMPLSCKGRYRDSEPSRGDVDDTLGNFTLTLIDSVDTLAVLGDVEGFEEAVLNIIKDARFDCDVIVSVFETNIRILGGLLGGHVMAAYFKRRGMGLSWYNDELLSRAKEVGDRLLPAFNTSTGIPYPRINLKHGIVPQITSSYRDTCTACAGSMILEFAALSRLTGIAVYEEKARKAMDYLWQQRHRTSDLMGLIINIHNGDWIRRESGVGAGIDSYYEYVLKAYILLGDDNYLDRFNKHYDAVMRYVSQGPLLMDVHMHKPHAISRNFMDALLAFWPGLQVLKGDLVPAIETHEMLYQVLQRHNFIPEAFTTDFRVHWGHHPLRPEFIESTYFLYKATGDNYYLEVGKKVLDNLETHARVSCGLAAIKNVKTGAHEDQMDSYVLAETFKYLYLLFAEKEDLAVDIDDFIFTTEAHLLPLSLSIGNLSVSVPKIRRDAYSFKVDISPPVSDNYVTATTPGGDEKDNDDDNDDDDEKNAKVGDNMCPALHTTHKAGKGYPHTVRSQVQYIVNRANPQRQNRTPRLRASQFIAGNKEQLEQLHAMGIRIATMADGRVQLLHTASEALSPEDADNGMQFMQEMIDLSKHQQQEREKGEDHWFPSTQTNYSDYDDYDDDDYDEDYDDEDYDDEEGEEFYEELEDDLEETPTQHDPMFIHVSIPGLEETQTIRAGPAQFGYDLKEEPAVKGMLAIARPFRVCKDVENVEELAGHVVILERGECMFVDKARNLERIGARGGIVIDHTEGSTSDSQPLFAMSGDGTNDVTIPLVFLYHAQGQQLLQLLADNSFLEVALSASSESPSEKSLKSSSGITAMPEPQEIEASSGKMADTPPLPLHHGKPGVPPTTASESETGDGEEEEEEENSFLQTLEDKFYHHVAQLRDLYYLQTGSRYLHINVEVRPSATKPKPLTEQENTFSLDVLPDNSKMITVRLTYQADGFEQVKPHLNQLYVDSVYLIQRHTNLDDLQHATDYLRALARSLEAGYFGLQTVDRDTLTLMRWLSRQLQYVHIFPAEPQKSDARSDSAASSESSDGGSESPSEGAKSYAGVEDFVESSPSQRQPSSSVGEGEGIEITDINQYIRFTSPEQGDSGYAARVDEDGRLNLVQDPSDPSSSGQRRNAFSVHMSTDDTDRDNIRVKISNDEALVSQSQSFSVKESADPASAKDQSHVTTAAAAAAQELAAVSGDESQSSDSSGSSSSQSGESLADSEAGGERTAGREGSSGEGGSIQGLGRGEGSTPLGESEGSDRTLRVTTTQQEEGEGHQGRGERTPDHRPDDEL